MKSRRSIFTNRHLAVEIWLRASPFQRSRFAGHALRTPHSRDSAERKGQGGCYFVNCFTSFTDAFPIEPRRNGAAYGISTYI